MIPPIQTAGGKEPNIVYAEIVTLRSYVGVHMESVFNTSQLKRFV